MSKINFAKWAKDNMVLLVIVPLIGGIHWGWYKLQSVPYLVEPGEKRTEMPLISALKVYKNRVLESIKSSPKEPPMEKVADK